MRKKVLHESPELSWILLARDPERPEDVIDTNEYIIVTPERAVMMDPGGTEIFPQVVAAVSEILDIGKVDTFFCTHQDPDVMSSLPLWMGLCPGARIHMPWLWTGFIAHFGHEYVQAFVPIPDEGHAIPLGNGLHDLRLIPAHYCHSSGNFSLHDPNTGILFSGDIGGALLPPGEQSIFVEDFARHIGLMEGFHKRWMPSNHAKNDWVRRVRALQPRMICPQHGSVFQGADVGRFLDWFEALEVGCGVP